MTKKVCSKCRVEKELGDFYAASKGRLGRTAKCKACKKVDALAFAAANPEQANAHKRRWRQKNSVQQAELCKRWERQRPTVRMVYAAKARAKALGLPFGLEPAQLLIPLQCPFCGRDLNQNLDTGKGRTGYERKSSPSLDKLRPELGYVLNNVQIICYSCNNQKRDATPASMTCWLSAIADGPGLTNEEWDALEKLVAKRQQLEAAA